MKVTNVPRFKITRNNPNTNAIIKYLTIFYFKVFTF